MSPENLPRARALAEELFGILIDPPPTPSMERYQAAKALAAEAARLYSPAKNYNPVALTMLMHTFLALVEADLPVIELVMPGLTDFGRADLN